jgi:hypothetical protein
MSSRTLLRLMLFMASILVCGQILFLMMNILPASFEGIGALSTQMISYILLQVVILSCIVGYLAWRSTLNKDAQSKGSLNPLSLLSFVAGLILCIEGLIAINLNNSVISGTTSTIMISTGLMLFTLGVLSMVTFVQGERITNYRFSSTFVALLVLTLLMLPPALLFI